MREKKVKHTKQEISVAGPSEDSGEIRNEFVEITEAVGEFVSETSLVDKVEELRTYIENISEDVENWRTSRVETYIEALETLKSQVDEIQNEWNSVSGSMKTQHERLEAILESFPGVIETSAIKALSMRMTHLEGLVSKLVEESNTQSATVRARRQYIISLIALGVTVVLWVLWMVLSFIK